MEQFQFLARYRITKVQQKQSLRGHGYCLLSLEDEVTGNIHFTKAITNNDKHLIVKLQILTGLPSIFNLTDLVGKKFEVWHNDIGKALASENTRETFAVDSKFNDMILRSNG